MEALKNFTEHRQAEDFFSLSNLNKWVRGVGTPDFK